MRHGVSCVDRQYTDAGVTWLLGGVVPGDEWLLRLRTVVENGPPS